MVCAGCVLCPQLGMLPNFFFFFFNDTATTEIYTLSLHDALPISNLKSIGISDLPPIDPAIEPAVSEPRVPKVSAQGPLRAIDPAVAATLHVVFGGKSLDVGDSAGQSSNLSESAAKIGAVDVLNDV